MSSIGFQFKQFYIKHDHCAMKVGTDGVLLGAWAGDAVNYQHILDIGTGSGLVALMLAQRYSQAHITGIDIDVEAYNQANENFTSSPWSHRLNALHNSLQDYCKQEITHFDLIVSNPPFFQDSLKAPDTQRNTARHTDTLPHSLLLSSVSHLLQSHGTFCVILPSEQINHFLQTALQYGLFEQKRLDIHPTPQRPSKRTLLALSKTESVSPQREKLIIEENGRHHYSSHYLQLTRAFYLDKPSSSQA